MTSMNMFDVAWLARYLSAKPTEQKRMMREHYFVIILLVVIIAIILWQSGNISKLFYGQNVFDPNSAVTNY